MGIYIPHAYHTWSTKSKYARPRYMHGTVSAVHMQNAGEVVLECNRAKQMKSASACFIPLQNRWTYVLRALFFVHLNSEMR